jgi:hypothetical protein
MYAMTIVGVNTSQRPPDGSEYWQQRSLRYVCALGHFAAYEPRNCLASSGHRIEDDQ